MSTINGFGTAFYGRIDEEPDKSYISTKWIYFLWMPLIPLASYRIYEKLLSEYERWSDFGIGESSTYQYKLRKVPLNLEQVRPIIIKYWCILISIVLGLFLLCYFG